MSDRLILDIELTDECHQTRHIYSSKEIDSDTIHNRYEHTVLHGKYTIKWVEDEFARAVNFNKDSRGDV